MKARVPLLYGQKILIRDGRSALEFGEPWATQDLLAAVVGVGDNLQVTGRPLV
jgi:hypothetical protein